MGFCAVLPSTVNKQISYNTYSKQAGEHCKYSNPSIQRDWYTFRNTGWFVMVKHSRLVGRVDDGINCRFRRSTTLVATILPGRRVGYHYVFRGERTKKKKKFATWPLDNLVAQHAVICIDLFTHGRVWALSKGAAAVGGAKSPHRASRQRGVQSMCSCNNKSSVKLKRTQQDGADQSDFSIVRC